MKTTLRKLRSLIYEALRPLDARDFFQIPADFEKNYSKYTGGMKFADEFDIGVMYVPLSKLSAAGVPSKVGDHVRHMIKVLKSGKKVPPIAVMITKTGKYIVQDGNTRVLALKAIKARGHVPAVVAAWYPKQLKNLEPVM